MNEIKQYKINDVVYEIEYHYTDDTQRNKHITNTEVRLTRVSLEMARRFFEMRILDDFRLLIELQEYEKLTGKLPELPFDFNNFRIGMINDKKDKTNEMEQER